MFDPFFEVIAPLIKDPELAQVFYRSFLIVANRSDELKQKCILFLQEATEFEEEQARKMGKVLLDDLAEL
jgi:hypothetical protein